MIRQSFYQYIRKSISRIGIFVFFLFLLIPAKAQVPSTEGVDFWLTFLYNWEMSDIPCTPNLIISAQRGCTGIISNPNTGWSTTFYVPAQGHIEVSIPIEQGFCTGSGTIENKGICVTSTDTISLYAANYIPYSFDATNVLPTHALGNEYLIQTYSGYRHGGSNIAFVATQNNTILDFTLSTAAGGYPPGITFSITLNKGQTYQLITDSFATDLSGTRVVSRDCKKFAVFAGCVCTQVPNGYCCCDHLIEQTWPITSWGKEFIVTHSQTLTFDRIRVTANDNNTQIYQDGSWLTTLNAGDMYEFEISSSQPAIYINANNPIALYLYFVGTGYGNLFGDGDPSMVWISPIEQSIRKITFGTCSPNQTYTQYVNIISPTLGVPSMRLDGANISSQFTTVPGNINYSYTRINISHATHTLEGNSGFVAHVYGLGKDESYSFSVGSSAANLKNKLYVNDVASVDISANQKYCMNETIIFRGYVETDYDAILWEFGDGMTEIGDTVSHFYPTSGYYTVNMIIDRRTSNNNCGGYDTISTIVRIFENEYSIYDTICAEVHYTENGFDVYTDRGGLITDTLFLLSSFGCDSTVILFLTVTPLPTIFLGNDRFVCLESQFPITLDAGSGLTSYEWSTGETSQTISVMQEGIYSVTVSSEENCTATDEIAIEFRNATVTIAQDPEDPCINSITLLTAYTDSSNPDDTFYWEYDGSMSPYFIPTVSGTYTVLVSLNCGITISSTVEIKFRDCDIEIPNVFTPNGDGINDVFKIEYDFEIFSFTISIYDRWGKLVFKSLQPDFQWDGKSSTGSECSDGVYYWTLGFSNNRGIYKEMNGTVTRITSSN